MKRSTDNSSPISYVRPGHFLFWKGNQYRMLPGERDDVLLLHLEDVTTGMHETVRVEVLFSAVEDEKDLPLFAPSLNALQQEIDARLPLPEPTLATGLPDHLLRQASHIVSVVETVEKAIATAEASVRAAGASAKNEPFRRTPALREACARLPEPVHLDPPLVLWTVS